MVAKKNRPVAKKSKAKPKARSAENPAVPLSSIAEGDGVYEALTGGGDGGSGVRVNHKRALGHSAIWRGVSLIAGSVGRHDFRVYRYVEGGGLVEDSQHQAARVMRRPTASMTRFTFRQTLQAHALLHGNGYAYIFRDGFGRPLELLILDPSRTWPVVVNGETWYLSQVNRPVPGKRRSAADFVKLKGCDTLHIKGLGFDGLVGYDVVKVLRESIGGALAARDYGSRYFKNNASPGIVLEVPANMPEKAIKILRDSWAELHEGVHNAHRAAILRDGVKLASWAANARDAQLIENREFDTREIANILGVPPHKLGDPSRTAYNSLESENQSYQEDTLGPWFCQWEQECDLKLLTEIEKNEESHCCKFAPRPMAGVSLAGRGAYYVQALTNGWKNVDEVRALEGDNPLPGKAGQVYRTQLNLAPSVPAPAPAAEPATDPSATPQGAA